MQTPEPQPDRHLIPKNEIEYYGLSPAEVALRDLPAKDQAQVIQWIADLGFANTLAKLRETHGLDLTATELRTFRRWHELARDLGDVSNLTSDIYGVEKYLEEDLEDPCWTAALQRIFELQALRQRDLKAYLRLQICRQRNVKTTVQLQRHQHWLDQEEQAEERAARREHIRKLAGYPSADEFLYAHFLALAKNGGDATQPPKPGDGAQPHAKGDASPNN
ncbi:MAG: hypothetical protein AB1705_25995 [Verrucomicrobiota bacterium]